MASLAARYHVLFIAPYPELVPVVRDAAQDYPELDVTIHEGDLSKGLSAALGSMESDYDVVVSRGGTAQLLEDEFSIPVFEVPVSPVDLYDCLLAHNPSGKRCAIVGFDNVIRPLLDVANFSDFDLDIHGVAFEDELPLVLREVQDGGYEVVFCDTFSLPHCHKLGLNAHLLASGRQSVARALGDALSFCERSHDLLSHNHMLWSLVMTQDARFSVFSSDGRLTYCNLEQRRDELVAFMRSHLERHQEERLVVRRGHHLYRIHKVPIENDGEHYLAFSITRSRNPSANALVGIAQRNREEVSERYHASAFCQTRASESLASSILAVAKSKRPILLTGEPSAGKVPTAELIYLTSGWSAHPFVSIDCPLLNDRSWKYLVSSPNSPLFGPEATILFGSVQGLGKDRLRQLLDILERSGALERDHVVVTTSGAMTIDPETLGLLYDHLHFHELNVPPLRDRPDFDTAVTLYLNALSLDDGVARPTVSDEAAAVLRDHGWPGNYAELTVVMERCLSLAAGGRITAKMATAAIETSHDIMVSGPPGTREVSGIELMRPLRDIERDVVRETIERCGGNQTEAAHVLGVSRTTIWRLMKPDA